MNCTIYISYEIKLDFYGKEQNIKIVNFSRKIIIFSEIIVNLYIFWDTLHYVVIDNA